MVKRRRRRKPPTGVQGAIGFTALGATAGVGASVLGSTGTTAGTSAASGISNITSFAPAAGNVFGAGLVIRQLGQLPIPKRRKKKRRK